MNFEHFFKLVYLNKTKIKNKKKLKKILFYFAEIRHIHKQKLKLGHIKFEINEKIDLNDVIIKEPIQIKYINQAVSTSDPITDVLEFFK